MGGFKDEKLLGEEKTAVGFRKTSRKQQHVFDLEIQQQPRNSQRLLHCIIGTSH